MDRIIYIIHANFNPRLREGGDPGGGPGGQDFTISIHASAREATTQKISLLIPVIISIHASAREATALITKIHLKYHISFQHTVHKSPFNVNYLFQ